AAFGDNPLGLVPSLATPGEGVMVEGVLHGGPADQADLRRGDRILMIDGRPLVDWTTRVSLPATLTVERSGKKEQVQLKSDKF
ncbi:MAG: PDZ domain-containing protein, partial [Nitrospirota bacterium]